MCVASHRLTVGRAGRAEEGNWILKPRETVWLDRGDAELAPGFRNGRLLAHCNAASMR
jgi:hypothetical protein